MQILPINSEKDLSELKEKAKLSVSGCVLALGFFDGVHIAHRAIIEKAGNEAKKLGIPLTVFTFSSSSKALKPEQVRLFTDSEKLDEFESLGADLTVIFDFDLIKNVSKDEFIDKILIEKLNTAVAVCGFNFRFGKGASGNAELLSKKMTERGRKTVTVAEYTENGNSVSSSVIREMLSENKLVSAARLLGKPFFIDGKVTHGLGLGKNLGFPTVNVEIPSEKFSLSNGVYLTAVEISDKLYTGITNVGSCPTFDERETHTETFILDFDDNIYQSKIRIYFIKFLRNEIKFSSAEELIMQINIDKNRALELKKEIQWQEIGLSLQ